MQQQRGTTNTWLDVATVPTTTKVDSPAALPSRTTTANDDENACVPKLFLSSLSSSSAPVAETRTTGRLPYDLWTEPTLFSPNRAARAVEFWSNLKTVVTAMELSTGAVFTPHAFVQDGIQAGCHEVPKIFDNDDDENDDDMDDNTNDDPNKDDSSDTNNQDNHHYDDGDGEHPCYNMCTHHGRYCAADPDGNLHSGLSGQDIVKESLRRLCIWRTLKEQQEQQQYHDDNDDNNNADHHKRDHHHTHREPFYAKWFAYVAEFQRHCYNSQDPAHTTTSRNHNRSDDSKNDDSKNDDAAAYNDEWAHHFRNPVCRQQVYDIVGIDDDMSAQIEDDCMQVDNNLETIDGEDRPSPLLEYELHLATQRAIYMDPTVQVTLPMSPHKTLNTENGHNQHQMSTTTATPKVENNTKANNDKENQDKDDKDKNKYNKDKEGDKNDSGGSKNDKKSAAEPHYQSLFGSDVTPQAIFSMLCSVSSSSSSSSFSSLLPPPRICQACQTCPHLMQCLESNGHMCHESIDKHHHQQHYSWRSTLFFWCLVVTISLFMVLRERSRRSRFPYSIAGPYHRDLNNLSESSSYHSHIVMASQQHESHHTLQLEENGDCEEPEAQYRQPLLQPQFPRFSNNTNINNNNPKQNDNQDNDHTHNSHEDSSSSSSSHRDSNTTLPNFLLTPTSTTDTTIPTSPFLSPRLMIDVEEGQGQSHDIPGQQDHDAMVVVLEDDESDDDDVANAPTSATTCSMIKKPVMDE